MRKFDVPKNFTPSVFSVTFAGNINLKIYFMKKSLLFACAAMACFSMSAEDLVVFSESANAEDTYWDPSWTTTTGSSKFIATTAGKIDISKTAHEGAQSLSISWTSATGGDWGACVAREGWATYDLSKYNELNFWVYSETAIAAENLPAMQMENGGYQKSEKIAMGDFLPSGVPAKTWTLVKIAREDIANEGFGIANVKSIFFCQNAADNAAHTMLIDDIVWKYDESYVTPDNVALFQDSNEDGFFDPSWVNVTAPSTVKMLEGHNEKLPTTTDIKKEGNNALELTWTSAEGGNWMALCASIGWIKFDITDKNYVTMWLYSPAALTKDELPNVHLEAHVGGTTGKVALGNYVNGLAANTWTEVAVSIEDLKKANPEFTAFDNIKGLFFSQNAADGKQHTLYIDEVYFSKNESSSVNDIEYTSENAIYYANGNVYGVAGNVSVFNVAGQLVAEGTAVDNTFAVALNNGLYIVVSENGNSKIVVR